MLVVEPTWDTRIKIYGYEYIFITLFQLFQVFNRKFSENGSTRTFFFREIICCITLFQLFQVSDRKFFENGGKKTFFSGKLSEKSGEKKTFSDEILNTLLKKLGTIGTILFYICNLLTCITLTITLTYYFFEVPLRIVLEHRWNTLEHLCISVHFSYLRSSRRSWN